MDVSERALADLAFAAAVVDEPAPRAELRTQLLGATGRAGRPSMHLAWSDRASASRAYSAFVRTAAELGDLFDDLAPDEWARSTRMPTGSIRDLAVHLVGVERYALGQLGRRTPRPAPRREDHYRVSVSATQDLLDAPGDRAARAWWVEVMEVLRACGELDPAHPLVFHHLAGDVRGFLVARTFEIWAHGEDIRRATGREPNELDADRLALMSSGLLDVLAFGMALSGTDRPGRTARIELTGPGGSSFDVALGAGEAPGGQPDITIAAPTLDLCRVAARRLPIDSLDVTVDGDRSLLQPILVGATAFAAD